MELPSFAELVKSLGLDRYGRPILPQPGSENVHAPDPESPTLSASKPITTTPRRPPAAAARRAARPCQSSAARTAQGPPTAWRHSRPDSPQLNFKPGSSLAIVEESEMWGPPGAFRWHPRPLLELFDLPPEGISTSHGMPIAYFARPVPVGVPTASVRLAYAGVPSDWVMPGPEPRGIRHPRIMRVEAISDAVLDANKGWRGRVHWHAFPVWIEKPTDDSLQSYTSKATSSDIVDEIDSD
ncbi:hypothetical protein BV25DRAFT_1826127 [Artomyces pyxidatus]|uniref:Uncharacterized protein n=1 Tax=Artomyces pyxidatus TaxID=48021 RepID=A0ACB8T0E8_9AGAM|nr:hypothetical protein BV25DRAFT_1826127 [Artomyces pyxidatus]